MSNKHTELMAAIIQEKRAIMFEYAKEVIHALGLNWELQNRLIPMLEQLEQKDALMYQMLESALKALEFSENTLRLRDEEIKSLNERLIKSKRKKDER